LAGTAGTPVNSKLGNVTKLPPPATAFITPPSRAARNSSIPVEKPWLSGSNQLEMCGLRAKAHNLFYSGTRSDRAVLPKEKIS
jgi:hypothetical protein